MSNQTWLIVTPGEPAGIGPDLILKIIHQAQFRNLIVVADIELLLERAESLSLEFPFRILDTDLPARPDNKYVYIHHVPLAEKVTTGQLNKQNAAYVLNCLNKAIAICSEHENCALITGPVHKGIINDAGIPFTGHTEYLADKAQIELPVMMLATTGLKVALTTTHLPLAKVAETITKELLTKVLTILHADLKQKFRILNPHIIVCGLNPHAGESGHLGREEQIIIEPVLNELRGQGMKLTGPLPADTAFTQQKIRSCDAYLAMYHDQGLPVLKHIGFGNAVNITLGLPFIRTSVDHGTALELAGTGDADIASFKLALETAQQMLTSD